jgi:hypothetical protein
MTERTRSTRDSELVKTAYARDQIEAELIQGLLSAAGVRSVVRRAPGFDVPEFLTAAPREVLVAASDVGVARAVLGEHDSHEPTAPSASAANWRRRLIAALLVALALVAFVVCLATDVLG